MMETTAISREVGARLRECRERIGLKAHEVAETLGWSASKVSRLESGIRIPGQVDVAMYLGCCGVPQEIAKHLLELVAEPDTGFWVRPHHKKLPDQLLSLIMNETAAATICNFEPLVVPGLVQTESYAREIIRARITAGPEDVQPRVKARLIRQQLLSRPQPPQTVFFINEAVLRHRVGGPDVMSEQLLHLVFATAKPQVKVRVIPTSVGAHAALGGRFLLLHYLDRRPLVWLEHIGASVLVEDREVVDLYRTIRSELYRIALDEEQSRAMLADLASQYEAEEHDVGAGLDRLA